MTKALGREKHIEALTAWRDAEYSENKAADILGTGRSTMQGRLKKARLWMRTKEGKEWAKANNIGAASSKPEIQVLHLTSQLKEATSKLAAFQQDNLRTEQVREYIFGLSKHQPPAPPEWTNDRKIFKYDHGIPTLLLSDLHYGEVVVPQQVFNSNKFNAEICIERVKRVIDKTVYLTHDVLRESDQPGIVLALGGDNINGHMLHDELGIGSDRLIMTQTIEIADVLHSAIHKLLRNFAYVFVVGVAGNHGRNTRKPWAKFYAETNFDWLVYQMLERFFTREIAAGKVAFLSPPARDVTYRVAGRSFRLTHGDQFRGGDSIIGPLGPVTRGDNKKRAMAMNLPTEDEEYDTLLIGHFHSLYMTPKLIINGAVKGYDEYAMSNNFGYEPPQQALFFTHEKYGMNHFMPVLCDEPNTQYGAKVPWVEFRKGNTAINNHSEWGRVS